MRASFLAIGVSLVVASASLSVDDLSVVVDPAVKLAAFRTFSLRNAKIDSPRPELDNPLFVKKLRATIRAALIERGLTETAGPADVFVDFMIAGEDFAVGVPTPGLRGVGPQPVRFTEGTLVIDLVRPSDSNPAWRGVYRDDEPTGSKLMQKLPDDAKKLVSRLPRFSK